MKHLALRKFILIFGVLLASLIVLPPRGLFAQKTFKTADAHFSKGNYPRALQLYKKGLDNTKIEAKYKNRIYSQIARCYKELNYYKPAKQWLEKALRINSHDTAIYPLYAEILRCNGYYQKALSYYYKYNKAVSDSVILRNMLVAISYPEANNYINPLVSVQGQYAINTFGKKRGLQFLNDKLYYSTTGYMLDPMISDYEEHIYDYYMFKSNVSGNILENTVPENDIPVFVRNKVISFAKQPGTDILFFVAVNKKGTPKLYCSHIKGGVYSSKSDVKIGGRSLPVEHIAFSDDGNRMFFSAYLEGYGGFGNNDLWYSDLVDGEWKKPINMGANINTKGDEITPFVYHNTLFFSSNGQPYNYGGFDIYSVTFGTQNAEVCNIKMPYNSFADDFAFIISPYNNGGFFVSTRDTNILDDRIYAFSEIPNFTFCRGSFFDNNGNTLDNVNISLLDSLTNKLVYMTKSGKNGNYGLFLNNDKAYRIEFEKENFFSLKIDLGSLKNNSKTVANKTKTENIVLNGLDLNTPYKIDNVFNQTADVEVQNTLRLSSFTTFIKENPNLVLYVHLFGYLSSDDYFNKMLNEKRLENLKKFLCNQGIAESRISCKGYENEKPTNFPATDPVIDKTYVLYFVITPMETNTIFPKTVGHRPF